MAARSAGGIALLTSTVHPSALSTSMPRSVIPSSTSILMVTANRLSPLLVSWMGARVRPAQGDAPRAGFQEESVFARSAPGRHLPLFAFADRGPRCGRPLTPAITDHDSVAPQRRGRGEQRTQRKARVSRGARDSLMDPISAATSAEG